MLTPVSHAPPALTCSVVIATRRRPREVAACLESLRAQSSPPLEILVVDNSQSDAGTRAAAERFGVRYLAAPVGALCAARNAGARAALGDVVAFADDDAVPDQDWIAELLRGFEDPTVAAVTGRIRPLDVSTDAKRSAVASGIGSTFDRDTPATLDRATPDWFAIAAFGGMGNGANMAFRRTLFAAGFEFHERTGRGTPVTGFDEHYAFLELVAQGHKIVYRPRAVVWHPVPDSVAELRRQRLRDTAAVSAFATLLLMETRHRAALGKFVWQALRRTRRPWRVYDPTPVPRLVPRRRLALALASGPFRYLWGLVPGNDGSESVARR